MQSDQTTDEPLRWDPGCSRVCLTYDWSKSETSDLDWERVVRAGIACEDRVRGSFQSHSVSKTPLTRHAPSLTLGACHPLPAKPGCSRVWPSYDWSKSETSDLDWERGKRACDTAPAHVFPHSYRGRSE